MVSDYGKEYWVREGNVFGVGCTRLLGFECIIQVFAVYLILCRYYYFIVI